MLREKIHCSRCRELGCLYHVLYYINHTQSAFQLIERVGARCYNRIFGCVYFVLVYSLASSCLQIAKPTVDYAERTQAEYVTERAARRCVTCTNTRVHKAMPKSARELRPQKIL